MSCIDVFIAPYLVFHASCGTYLCGHGFFARRDDLVRSHAASGLSLVRTVERAGQNHVRRFAERSLSGHRASRGRVASSYGQGFFAAASMALWQRVLLYRSRTQLHGRRSQTSLLDIFSLKRAAFQTIRPVVSRESAVFPYALGRAALCRCPAFSLFQR